MNSASSNPASLIPLAALINRNSSVQVALSDATGTASFNWYDADSGQTLTTNLTFVADKIRPRRPSGVVCGT